MLGVRPYGDTPRSRSQLDTAPRSRKCWLMHPARLGASKSNRHWRSDMSKRPSTSLALVVTALALVATAAGTALAGPTVTAAKKKHADAKADAKLFKSLLK